MTAVEIAVHRGSPDEVELAALVAALAVLGSGYGRGRRLSPHRSAWAVPGARPGSGRRWAGRRWAPVAHPGDPV